MAGFVFVAMDVILFYSSSTSRDFCFTKAGPFSFDPDSFPNGTIFSFHILQYPYVITSLDITGTSKTYLSIFYHETAPWIHSDRFP